MLASKKMLTLLCMPLIAFCMENELSKELEKLSLSQQKTPAIAIAGSIRFWVEISDTQKVAIYFNRTYDGQENLSGQMVKKAGLKILRPQVRNLTEEEAKMYWDQYITQLLPKSDK